MCAKHNSTDNGLRTYALDRVESVHLRKTKFKLPTAIDLPNYFTHCFGIILPTNETPQAITFTFDNGQANYIINYPLHTSQRVIKVTKSHTTFEITVFVTYDLLVELLSYGETIKINSPKTLVKEMIAIYTHTLRNYA